MGMVRPLPSFLSLFLLFSFTPPPTHYRASRHLSHFIIPLAWSGADDRYYYEKKFDECRGVIQPEMALPMGIPGAFGLPVSLPFASCPFPHMRGSFAG
jgi:hypothetical protein